MRALFLDLDGTLITTKSGRKFPKDIHDWEFRPHVLDIAEQAKKDGLLLIIVTNQGGIEKGILKEVDFKEKIRCLSEQLAIKTGFKRAEDLFFYYATTTRSNDYNRKPNPGMAYRAALDHGLVLKECLMIGDASGKPGNHSADDVNFAKAAGIGKYIDVEEATFDKFFFTYTVWKEKVTKKERIERKNFFDDINDEHA